MNAGEVALRLYILVYVCREKINLKLNLKVELICFSTHDLTDNDKV